jgi:predicted nucleic acid-binding protein
MRYSEGLAPVPTHCRARKTFIEAQHPLGVRETIHGAYVKTSRTEAGVRPGTRMGQDNEHVFRGLLGVVDEVFSVERRDVLRARDILMGMPALSARDSIHLAVMQRHRITRLLSFDCGFDGLPGVRRLR